MELAFAAGEWAAAGAAIGVVAASLAAALTAWKLIDRTAAAIRTVVREEQQPLQAQMAEVQVQVTETRDEQRESIDHATRRDDRLDDHAEKLGALDTRVTRVEHHLWPEEVN